MSNIFEKIAGTSVKKSAFDLSHERKLSLKMGDLVPIYMDEVLPSDEFRVNTEVMMRFAPMIAPVMHRVNVWVHYFFVPNRIIWNEWEDFITGGKDGMSAPNLPRMLWGGGADQRKGSLGDYLGLPVFNTSQSIGQEVSTLPFRAYQQIYNDYYRDETLSDEIDITNVSAITDLRQRSWEKDYFTSALPFAQRGPAVGIPLSVDYADQTTVVTANTGSPLQPSVNLQAGPTSQSNKVYDANGNALRIENLTGLEGTLEDLRTASALQRWLEKQARGGYRYIETIMSHFGVRSSDARLQRAEYLGGGKQPVVISEVLNTSDTANAPQGNMAGHGISVGNINHFKKRFEEHGYVLGIMSVLPKATYQQGIERHWSRQEKEEFYWPEFANLGEQEVLGKEIKQDGSSAFNNDRTFGYQQRYAEYKYAQSTVHGEFRESLDFWHWGRQFTNTPVLDDNFIRARYGLDGGIRKDPFAVTADDVDTLYCQVYNNVKARRPMPYFSNPSLR